MSDSTEKQTNQSELDRLSRRYRHIGFAIFGGLSALLAGVLAYAAVTGYMAGEVYDPVTGKNVVGGPEHPQLLGAEVLPEASQK